MERQIALIESGGKVEQETRLYDPDRNETRPMRSKEEANDYRYFPDPDLLPLVLEEGFIESVRATLPELPDAKKTRFASQYGLSAYDAGVLTATREMADFYEKTATASGGELKQFFLAMGKYDGVIVGELPDDETAARLALSFGALANFCIAGVAFQDGI